MGGARVLVQLPLDRWRFPQNFELSHDSLGYIVFEIYDFSISLVTVGFFIVWGSNFYWAQECYDVVGCYINTICFVSD